MRQSCSVPAWWQRVGARGLRLVLVAACWAVIAPVAHAGLEEGRVKAQACLACHGADGNSALPGIPSLAGQPRQFLVTALFMFREGRRQSEQMAPFASQLSNADLNDLAQFFAAQKLAAPVRQSSDEALARGKQLTTANNCMACHTPTLVGQQHIPRLAGQRSDYLLAQLKAFKAGQRGDLDGTMTSAAQALRDEDLAPLADYLANLAVP